MTDDKDLSGGSLPPAKKTITDLELEEEIQRARWKTIVLCGSAFFIFVFYAVALALASYLIFFDPPYHIEIEHGVIVGLLLAVPTLISIHMFKLVSKNTEMTSEDLESIPLVRLGKEALTAFLSKKH